MTTVSVEIRGVIDRLLDLRELAGPLGWTGYRGPLHQRSIAKIAGVSTTFVWRMAIAHEPAATRSDTRAERDVPIADRGSPTGTCISCGESARRGAVTAA